MKAPFFALLAALAFPLAAHSAGPEHDHHGHGNDQPAKLQLDAGKKWATDLPLRQTMTDLNRGMADALPKIHQNRFSDADYQALAATIRNKVGYAVEHCKLAPKADAMLHLVIADLLAGAAAMEDKTPDGRHDGAVQVLRALQAYGKHFRHAGWKAAGG